MQVYLAANCYQEDSCEHRLIETASCESCLQDFGRMSPADFEQWRRFQQRRVKWRWLMVVVILLATTGAIFYLIEGAKTMGYVSLGFIVAGPLAIHFVVRIFDNFDTRYRKPRVSEACKYVGWCCYYYMKVRNINSMWTIVLEFVPLPQESGAIKPVFRNIAIVAAFRLDSLVLGHVCKDHAFSSSPGKHQPSTTRLFSICTRIKCGTWGIISLRINDLYWWYCDKVEENFDRDEGAWVAFLFPKCTSCGGVVRRCLACSGAIPFQKNNKKNFKTSLRSL